MYKLGAYNTDGRLEYLRTANTKKELNTYTKV